MEKNLKNSTKISGYLEKKGKKKIVSSYKKYWFVLEGSLLLYYRSKDDYETISPCKGSINLGPPCIVKPCPALNGAFQIQTRTTTVILRAESREEQNKWMQAIILEINPNKNQYKMSHFRYSMENLIQNEDIISASPESDSSQNSTENIIQRLQKLGAQSYNPTGTINKLATLKEKERTILRNSLKAKDSKSAEHIYERISAEFKEDVQNNLKEADKVSQKSLPELSHASNTLKIKQEENDSNAFLIENDTYAIRIQQKDTREKKKNVKKKLKLSFKKSNFFSTPKQHSQEENVIVENDTYASSEYSDAITKENDKYKDFNKNNLIQNKTEIFEDENLYSLLNFSEETINKTDESVEVEYTEPSLLETTSQDNTKLSNEEKIKNKNKMKNKKKDKSEEKLKKKPSFIKRVWKKKIKGKDKGEIKVENKINNVDDEDLYEAVPATIVEKVSVTDSTAVQMLFELQNILEHKMPILMERISSDLKSPTGSAKMEFVPEYVKSNAEKQLTDSSVLEKESLILQSNCDKYIEPKDLPQKKYKGDSEKSLDQILEDLDKQSNNIGKCTVKKLIKRFSESDEVILRNKKYESFNKRGEVECNELGKLLQQLAEMTNAPILTPGVTSSLNGSTVPENELTKLLPSKQRRFSEPDYDIPRPHKSLTILPKVDILKEKTIGSTRFFGPVLKASDMIVPHQRYSSEVLQPQSITPDSLENDTVVDSQQDERVHCDLYEKFLSKEAFLLNKTSAEDTNTDIMVDNEIYAEPRSISMNFQLERDKHLDSDQETVFADSLEICKNEVLTKF